MNIHGYIKTDILIINTCGEREEKSPNRKRFLAEATK